jgi:sterol desaturase/sphingolipid hydroxylase (fatty acid hydroxylase superfamily)
MEAILPILIPSTFALMLVFERLFPGRQLPKVRFWLAKGIVFFVLTGAVNAVVPAIAAMLLRGWSPLHLSGVGVVPGALLGAVLADLVGYWLHRLMHKVPFIWRWSHQMHHSAERMDLAGMSYTHPFEIVFAFTLSAIATSLLGLSPDAAALAGFLGFATAVVQHMNVRTPAWLGYFVARPEMHGIHHARGIHAYNYASFPIWDILFGTFRNPAKAAFPEAYGFWDGASARVGAMLVGRNVGDEAA